MDTIAPSNEWTYRHYYQGFSVHAQQNIHALLQGWMRANLFSDYFGIRETNKCGSRAPDYRPAYTPGTSAGACLTLFRYAVFWCRVELGLVAASTHARLQAGLYVQRFRNLRQK